MNQKQLVEFYTGLYKDIADEYEKQTSAKPTTAELNMIFEQTCKRIISDLIGKQRSSGGSTQTTQTDDKPTDKQIMFAEKLGCKDPGNYTKKDLSAWIEEHKNW